MKADIREKIMNRKDHRAVWVPLIIIICAVFLVFAGRAVFGQASGGGGGAPAVSSLTCVFSATGEDVEVQVTGPEPDCNPWEKNLAPDGLSWSPIGVLAAPGSNGPADGETMELVCTLQANGLTMTVEDAGGATYGTATCSAEEQNGWVTAP
jgi:hypothetical protein